LSCEEDWQTHSSDIASEGCKLYRFIVETGATYTFKTGCDDGATATFDTYLSLLDENCNEITYNDDGCEENRSKIEWVSDLPDGTPVYLRVSGFEQAFGSYTLAFMKESSLSYTVTTSSNPSNGGTTTGSGIYVNGSEVTVSASVNNGFTFINWTENGSVVSTSNDYTFTINSDRTLVANFTSDQTYYTITTYSIPSNWGNTYGGGSFLSGTIVNVIAVPVDGYKFEYWFENGNIVCTNSVYTFAVTNNRNLYAYFSRDEFTDVKEADSITNMEDVFILYPNPVIDILNIKTLIYTERDYTLTIYNAAGKMLRKEMTDFSDSEETHMIDVSEFPSGLYFIRIQGVHSQQTMMFIKE